MPNQAFTDGPTLNNGATMPWLGLGVYKVWEADEALRAVSTAIAAGYRSIDTAAMYQNEEAVGLAIRECGLPRRELFVTTKVWNTDQGYDSTLRAFEASRQRLGLNYIDLYLVHWPVRGKYRETWRALAHLYREGDARGIGVSNHQIPHLIAIIDDTGVTPAVNQIELHPLLTQKELLQFAREQGIQPEAWRPLMGGNLDLPVLRQLAAKYGRTAAQIALRWNIQNGVVVIPKSVHEERIRENSQIFDFELEAADLAAIDGLNENRRFGPDPDQVNF
ncbi:MAG: aldo/keto reductase [Thermacetogeniaceae bacterium]